jgi:ubiquinone/menaquinone biosynthesis C-methylase UbiE
MDSATFDVEAQIEETHWWFQGRRLLFRLLIEEVTVPLEAPVLDVGTSTGTNLRLLREMGFSNVRGVDMREEARRYCEKKGLGSVTIGDATKLPFSDETFGLVLATDVIEHIDDDHAAVTEFARVMMPGGVLLVTVPAFQALWGLQDIKAHHKRRYTMSSLLSVINKSELSIEKSFYFNYILFLPILIARQFIRLLPIDLASENEINAPWLNRLLLTIFSLDVRTARFLKPAFGVSALVLVRRR